MKLLLVYLLSCLFILVPFFSSYGLVLLFLNKSKWGKKYLAYFIKNKMGYLRIDHKKLGDEKINMIAIYLIKAY